jgi:hypothetical protein
MHFKILCYLITVMWSYKNYGDVEFHLFKVSGVLYAPCRSN